MLQFQTKKVLIFSFLFLLLAGLVLAVPSSDTFIIDESEGVVDSLRIVPVFNPVVQSGEGYNLFFEVFHNYSHVDFDNTDCSLRLFKGGEYFQTDEFNVGVNGKTFNFFVNDSNFTKPGVYTGLITCNNSVLGKSGFVEYKFRAQQDGLFVLDSGLALVGLTGLVAFLIGLLWITFSIDSSEHFNLRLLLLFISVIVLLGVLNYSMTLLNSVNPDMLVSQVLSTMYYVGVYSMFLFFAYFILFYFIPKIFYWINDNFIKNSGGRK